jgi:TonB family protein
LRATVTMEMGKKQTAGEYGLNWWSPERWQESVKFGDFGRGREGVQGGYWQSRVTDYQPEAIFAMDRVLDPAALLRLGPDEVVLKTSTDKNHGNPLACVDVGKNDKPKYPNRKLCFDEASGKLVRAELHGPVLLAGVGTVEYSDFVALGEKQFPTKIKLTRKDGASMDIAISKFAALTGQPPAVTKNDKSEFWGWCEDMAFPALDKQTAIPVYPEQSKANHEQGEVKMYARIAVDGSLGHLTVLESPSQLLSQSAVNAVSQWKYKPATCGDKAVETEIVVEVIFTLGS